MARKKQVKVPIEEDFSPTEVAELGLLGIKRAAIYRNIQAGVILTIQDGNGKLRITRDEILRLRKVWHVKGLAPMPEDDIDVALIKKAILRESGREGGLTWAARHSREEIAEQLRLKRRNASIRRVDPDGVLFGEALDRAVEKDQLAQLAHARRTNLERRLRNKQYGNRDSA